jgi:putative polyketide hydroxylase
MRQDSTSVLVIGGSLVGLSAAVFLAWRGVPCVVLERHAGSSPHPRAIGYTQRTMELFQAAGLGGRVPEVPASFRLRRARVESLAGAWFEESRWTPKGDERAPRPASSPHTGAAIAQDALEPILRSRAVELGAELRLGVELLGFEQDGSGVTATVRRRSDGETSTLRADYLLAADGHDSGIRASLGIAMTGRGHIRTLRSVLFRAPLEEYLKAGVSQFSVEQPGFKAFLTTYNDGRWALMFDDDVERDEETLRGLVHKAVGRSDLPVEIVATGRWELSAQVAERFSSGRVFLAGDAAHTLPPNRGGYGANTGIEDASNVAWKLASVLRGESSPALLDTYDVERRAVALLRHEQIFARPDYKSEARGIAEGVPIIDDEAMELGQLYRSAAVLGAGDALPRAMRPDEWAGQPGTRAPHVVLQEDHGRSSALDLFQRGWVLLAENARWRSAAADASAETGVDVACIVDGADVAPATPDALRSAFGLGRGGASLVRPDGYVAWRSADLPSDPSRALADALAIVAAAPIAPSFEPVGGAAEGFTAAVGVAMR